MASLALALGGCGADPPDPVEVEPGLEFPAAATCGARGWAYGGTATLDLTLDATPWCEACPFEAQRSVSARDDFSATLNVTAEGAASLVAYVNAESGHAVWVDLHGTGGFVDLPHVSWAHALAVKDDGAAEILFPTHPPEAQLVWLDVASGAEEVATCIGNGTYAALLPVAMSTNGGGSRAVATWDLESGYLGVVALSRTDGEGWAPAPLGLLDYEEIGAAQTGSGAWLVAGYHDGQGKLLREGGDEQDLPFTGTTEDDIDLAPELQVVAGEDDFAAILALGQEGIDIAWPGGELTRLPALSTSAPAQCDNSNDCGGNCILRSRTIGKRVAPFSYRGDVFVSYIELAIDATARVDVIPCEGDPESVCDCVPTIERDERQADFVIARVQASGDGEVVFRSEVPVTAMDLWLDARVAGDRLVFAFKEASTPLLRAASLDLSVLAPAP